MKNLSLFSLSIAFVALASGSLAAQDSKPAGGADAKPAVAPASPSKAESPQSTKQEAKPAATPAAPKTEKKKTVSDSETKIAVSEPGVPAGKSGSNKKETDTHSHPGGEPNKASSPNSASPK